MKTLDAPDIFVVSSWMSLTENGWMPVSLKDGSSAGMYLDRVTNLFNGSRNGKWQNNPKTKSY